MSFTFSSESSGNESTVRVRGALDAATTDDFAELLESFVGAYHVIVLDLSEVTALDPLVLAVLLEARQRAIAESGSLAIRNPSTVVRRILEGAGGLGLLERDTD